MLERHRFPGQRAVRQPWRRFIDLIAPYRPALHEYCRRLTGNVWDGEDLVQDTLVRVFSLLGRTNVSLEHPKAYLLRVATNLWIDRTRRAAREQAALVLEHAEPTTSPPVEREDSRAAVRTLFQKLHPQERAAFLLKDVCALSLEETATVLRTSVGAVKSALSRARGRLDDRRPLADLDGPPWEIVERFARALSDGDLETMKQLCAEQVSVELVGGIELDSFDGARTVFKHAHMVWPALGFGERPWWKVDTFEGEPVVLGFRTLDGVEGLNEVHRLEVEAGRIERLRTYCFCPETLAVVARALGVRALPRPYRSPALMDVVPALLGLRQRWRR